VNLREENVDIQRRPVEVVVTKDVNERTEDVSDKVRHTEIEVEDERQLDQPAERRRARR
jgi:stress response protein YsnF